MFGAALQEKRHLCPGTLSGLFPLSPSEAYLQKTGSVFPQLLPDLPPAVLLSEAHEIAAIWPWDPGKCSATGRCYGLRWSLIILICHQLHLG